MWGLAQLLVFTGLSLQVPTYQPCILYHLLASCANKKLLWVPSLPANITLLYLEHNNISEINSSSLRNYDQLQELDLGWQHVQLIIRNNAFRNQRKLTRLVLSQYTAGLRLEPKAFAGLVNLRSLFLDSSNLTDSILEENYMEPLLSLEMLDLSYNKIVRLRPGLFFSKLKSFTTLKVVLNKITKICEEDLKGFRGKTFSLMDLHSNHLGKMFEDAACGNGNPFRGIHFINLNISSNWFTVKAAEQFFKIIQGTQISHLVFSNFMGKGFSHDNFPDPDENTFKGLMNSSVEVLDLSGNSIFALWRAVFSSLKNTIIIDISNNKINQIHSNAFTGLQGNLRMLNLSSNLLGEIRSHTFDGLTDLRVLDMSKNHIGVLGYEAFRGLPNLRGLFLTGNSLRTLGSPVSLPKLEVLLLDDNKLNSVYGISAFGRSSIHVDVKNNRLTNLEDVFTIAANFKRIQILFYGGNFIKMCECKLSPVPYNNSLQVLDLHDSSLNAVWAGGKCLNLFDHFENLLGLNLSFNLLTALPQGIFKGLRSVGEIDLSYNALTYLQPGVFPDSLKLLHMSNNFLASPDPASFSSLAALDLAGNRFHCDCNLQSFLVWLSAANVVLLSQPEEYRCEFPAEYYNMPLQDYQREMKFESCVDDEEAVEDVKVVLFIVFTLAVIAITLSGIVYTRFRGHIYVVYKRIIGRVLDGPRPTCLEEGQYDAFLCFTNSDYRWVEAALLKKLDNQFSEKNILRCCFESRDFLPGEDHLSNIRDAIWNSRRTVCIVSKEFLKDGWCLEAFTLAQGRMLEELTNVLIMMVVGKVAHYQLIKHNSIRAFALKRQYLVWPEDPQDLDWFYEQLVSQILKNTNVKKLTNGQPDLVNAAKDKIQPQLDHSVELEDIKTIAM
ncbi:toll-like receptor 5 [Betta splendens]|uniref:Toll-like receptor 5 n=1 Tax=Betta splendens TaxID=158456 RepID=A0A6P7LSY8_BETSP|nr:toll-like receptor 5 [Betta splendens]